MFESGLKTLAEPIDLHLMLRNCGWSRGRIFLPDRQCKEYLLTHIWGNPMAAIADATAVIAEDSDEGWWSWFEEPGQFDFCLRVLPNGRDQLKLLCWEARDVGSPIRRELSEDIAAWSMDVPKIYWIALVYGNLEKLRALLLQPDCLDGHREDFPYRQVEILRRFLNSLAAS
jgi:hypothetical protein